MQFKFLHVVVAGLAYTNTAAALSIDDVVDVIDGITKVSGDAADIAKSITSPFSIFKFAPNLINDFREIVQDVLKSVTTLGDAGNADFGEDEQGRICDAFHDFVEVHQNLLSIVIGKKGLLAKTPFSAPLGAVLRIVEGGVDKLANGLIDLVPTCAEKAEKDKKALDGTLDKAVSTYSFSFNSKQAPTDAEKAAMPEMAQDKAAMPEMAQDKAAMPAMNGAKVAARDMAKDKMGMPAMAEGKMGMPAKAEDKMGMPAMAEDKMAMPAMAKGRMSKSGMMKVRKEMPAMDEKMGMPAMAKAKAAGMAGTMDAN